MATTRIDYQYRDASNYKEEGEAFFAGAITPEQEARLRAALSDGDRFIPEQVGLTNMADEINGSYDDDHRWNELLAIKVLASDPPEDAEPIDAFVDRFAAVTDWEAELRIPWETEILAHHTTVPAVGWRASTQGPGGEFVAVAEDATLPLRPVPAIGMLVYSIRGWHGDVVTQTVETPGHLVITGEQLRWWAGRPLTEDEIKRLGEAIPNSSIPEAIAIIVDNL